MGAGPEVGILITEVSCTLITGEVHQAYNQQLEGQNSGILMVDPLPKHGEEILEIKQGEV
jgi:hypothetical protein